MDTERVIADLFIDRDAPVPLHYQIQVSLENCLRSGQLNPGDRLPNITDLSRLLNVSHVTALKAITELQKKGLLISKRGVGTVVAPKRVGATDIIMPSADGPEVGTQHWSFHHQLLDGLKKGFGETSRAFSLMYLGGTLCSPSEFLVSVHARRVDSIIAYRPIPDFTPLLSAAGREIPAVSLLYHLPGTPVHCVTPEVGSCINSMIQKRLSAGCRDFAYVAHETMNEERFQSATTNPYRGIYSAFCDILQQAGLKPSYHIIDTKKLDDEGRSADLRNDDGSKLKPGTVMLLQFPRLVGYLGELMGQTDIISYTESRLTVEMLGRQISLIYFGLDAAGRAAAELMKNGIVPGVGEQGIVVRPRAEELDLLKD